MTVDQGLPERPAPRRRSVRWQFTTLYSGLFLASGAMMTAVVWLIAGGSLEVAPAPGNGTGAMIGRGRTPRQHRGAAPRCYLPPMHHRCRSLRWKTSPACGWVSG